MNPWARFLDWLRDKRRPEADASAVPTITVADVERSMFMCLPPHGHFGPPPSVGWWPTRARDALRWWDGEFWSMEAYDWMTKEQAEKQAEWRADPGTQMKVMWRDRPADWPERSRT